MEEQMRRVFIFLTTGTSRVIYDMKVKARIARRLLQFILIRASWMLSNTI